MATVAVTCDSKETGGSLLCAEESAWLIQNEVSGDDDAAVSSTPGREGRARRLARASHKLLLVASLVANVALTILLYHMKVPLRDSERTGSNTFLTNAIREKSPYAGLEFNMNGTWEQDSPYVQEDIEAVDELWKAVDISNGFVAFTKDHAQQLGLPPSLPFPWDPQRKDLYLITSIHSMHCLTVLHRSNLEYRTNHTQTYSTEHILHCLDNLRTDIQCSADDTPRYVPPGATESTVKTGVGQIRQCRDWSKLNAWAEEHTACFKYNQFLYQELMGDKVYPWAWQFCDRNNEYLATVQKFLRKDSDWVAPLPEWPEIDEIQSKAATQA